jgi:trehalose synthase
MTTHANDEVAWLVEHSMLHQARQLAPRYAGSGRMWRHPYAQARPRDAAALASAWFTAYPAAIVTRPGESVLQTLSDPLLWQALGAIGIEGIHMGPMKRSGGLRGREFTPTIDGNFDRISFDIDPTYGTLEQFVAMSAAARSHGAVVIDDIIPSHTGKGADFRLATMRYGAYPGLYHMVEIDEADWGLLPPIPAGRDSINLPPATVDALKEKGYIVGQLTRVIFYEPGVKETDWSATDIVVGVDGVARRWVYLHYFKEGQPSLNWLDPSFAAQQLIIGDALHSIDTIGAQIVRLDANGFLGIERRTEGPAWSESHPLSIVGNQLIAGMMRKAGGFSFQELNLTVDDIAEMSHGGADLSYDFITRPAYHHALMTGDTEFLRLMFAIMSEYEIDPASLIHALQNHDELTLELVHFWTLHKDDRFSFRGRDVSGGELRELIRAEMYELLAGAHAPYNRRFVTNGVACTTASAIAAALRIPDITHLTHDQKERIKQAHLLLVMYNALQPGVFALSGWDLVGALTLPPETIAPLLADGDTRWIHRGAYDLVDLNPAAAASSAGIPRAPMVYGPLTEQLADPGSFASRLRDILAMRRHYALYAARQTQIPAAQSPGLLALVHELPSGATQITALNFSAQPVDETITIDGIGAARVVDMLTGQDAGEVTAGGRLRIALAGHAGASLLVRGG